MSAVQVRKRHSFLTFNFPTKVDDCQDRLRTNTG
jgi:hypothetical protein